MRRVFVIGFGVFLGAIVLGQGGTTGGGGGGFGGGGFGGGGAAMGGAGQGGNVGQQRYDQEVQNIERQIEEYLRAPEIKNILTPGQFSQWKLTMKKGQVLIADATSNVFDPALQVVKLKEGDDEEAPGTVLRENDDRYPGDQRPLLIWHCDQDGAYMLRARCFRDKSGGQFTIRMQTYESFDIPAGESTDFTLSGQSYFLLRMHLKAGEVRTVDASASKSDQRQWIGLRSVISPVGLPEADLIEPLSNVFQNSLMAPVEGDYYMIAQSNNSDGVKVHVWSKSYQPKQLHATANGLSGATYGGTPDMFQFKVKKGDVMRIELGNSSPDCILQYAEMPDVSKYSIATTLEDGKVNPFFPREPKLNEKPEEPALKYLDGRARDGRIQVFAAVRDATVWVATLGPGKQDVQYPIHVSTAVSPLGTSTQVSADLKIGNTDYLSFEAKAGDVMTFKADVTGFAGNFLIFDPSMDAIWSEQQKVDESSSTWNVIIRDPGRYLVAVSAVGDGGSGKYTLRRDQSSARVFSTTSQANGDFSTGQAEIWKFTAEPGKPLYIHWTSPAFNYSVSYIDEQGGQMSLPMVAVDKQNRFGILTVDKATTFVIVLTSTQKTPYSITLTDLPGYKPGGSP